jgi:hypothetical protein
MNGYSAGAGYDLATGLGSVNAYALTLGWAGAATAPSIVSLSPNPMTGSASSQSLTINGAGFVAGTGLKVTVGATSYLPSQVSGAQLVVNVNVGTAAQTLAVQVTNPNGLASNTVNLTVNAPVVPPAITTLGPSPMTGSDSGQLLTINGSGFLPGLKLLIGATTILASQLSTLTATELQVNVITGLTAHTYAVQVVNSNGGTSNSVNFQVTAPPVPAITSLGPNPLTGSTLTQTLTVTGTNFQSGAGLKVTVGSASYSGSSVTFVSTTQLKVTVAVAAGAKSLGVQVTNPSGEISNTATLTVH